MASHFFRLRKELDAKEQDIDQRQSTAEEMGKADYGAQARIQASIQTLTRMSTEIGNAQQQQAAAEYIGTATQELQAHLQAHVPENEELCNIYNELKALRVRLITLGVIPPAIDATMSIKSGAEDVVKHVVEKAIRIHHMPSHEIVQYILETHMRVGGCPTTTRGIYLQGYLMNVLLVDNRDSMRGVIEATTENLDIDEIIQHTLESLVDFYQGTQRVIESVKRAMDIICGKAETAADCEG
jgi:hypothetical protein